jgi:uncharacterized protein (TIGR03437 family)
MPMGTVSFDSAGKSFNLVEITITSQPGGTSVFHVDNIVAVPAVATSTVSSVLAATYLPGRPVAPESIVSAFGRGLASRTESASSHRLPVTLADTSVRVKDSVGVERQAMLFHVGPEQINYLLPAATAPGRAGIVVTSGGRVTATGTVDVATVAPGLFTADANGKGPPAAAAITVAPDLTRTDTPVIRCAPAQDTCVALPIDLGPIGTEVWLMLYGTGIRGVGALTDVNVSVGGVDADVKFAGAQSGFAGLDQVNIVIPRALAGRGEIDLQLTVEGKAANAVKLNIK